ncbi:uncharacterized protein LOC131248749 isoform X2 [Magnolia sinica]|uniref:uncharacterized protein LOC131248749 isoform X2 n=1 Tax=Magnolia sinica TaxID=86752 RepID=UPI0026581D49|nr:uncharacterized protein LOC131248749 isoform X2 [Magnolia sinica]
MPTFTAIAFDRLIEPGHPKSSSKTGTVAKLERQRSLSTVKRNHRAYILPALYATPEATPIPDSPTSFTPSPYIVNHKRRGPRLLKTLSQTSAVDCQQVNKKEKIDEDGVNATGDVSCTAAVSISSPSEQVHVNGFQDRKLQDDSPGDGLVGAEESTKSLPLETSAVDCQQVNRKEKIDEDGVNATGDVSCAAAVSISSPSEQVHVNGFQDRKLQDDSPGDGLVGADESTKSLPLDSERDGEGEDFFDPQDSVSVDTEMEDNGGIERMRKPYTLLGEYFDAFEELSAEGTPHSSRRYVEEELREIRLKLLMEIERRKQAEEALVKIQEQWQRIARQLSHVGLTLPEVSTVLAEEHEWPDVGPAEEMCQQVILARAVANSVGRGVARAELELEMESQIELKNFEITRLWDRLHYYETVNHEMSQRNQEAVGVTGTHTCWKCTDGELSMRLWPNQASNGPEISLTCAFCDVEFD